MDIGFIIEPRGGGEHLELNCEMLRFQELSELKGP